MFFSILSWGETNSEPKELIYLLNPWANLIKKLIKDKSKKTIVAFFWMPTGTKGVKPEILKNKEYFQDIKDSLEDISKETERKILSTISSGKNITEKTLFEKNFLLEIKRKLMKLKADGLPPLCTHDLINPNDPTIEAFHEASLDNKKSDKVKVIFYPIYLTGLRLFIKSKLSRKYSVISFGHIPIFLRTMGIYSVRGSCFRRWFRYY